MIIHIALYKWKDTVTRGQIDEVFNALIALGPTIPGLVGIACTQNVSKYSEGYSHVIYIRGISKEAIDAYRHHPEHTRIAALIDRMEDSGIGVDFSIPDDEG